MKLPYHTAILWTHCRPSTAAGIQPWAGWYEPSTRKRSLRGTARRPAMRQAHGAWRRRVILEHASPVIGSGLGKVG